MLHQDYSFVKAFWKLWVGCDDGFDVTYAPHVSLSVISETLPDSNKTRTKWRPHMSRDCTNSCVYIYVYIHVYVYVYICAHHVYIYIYIYMYLSRSLSLSLPLAWRT